MYMDFKVLLVLFPWALILVDAQAITEVLSRYSRQLSSLSALLKDSPIFDQQLKAADNFTFLAPSNDAISRWLAKDRSVDEIQATLQYHLLNGTYVKASISSRPQIVASSLTNTSYCNVTGGQKVKVSNNGSLLFESALQTRSSVVTTDIIARGGIVHIIDTVLELPIGPIETIQAENLSFFLAIASENGLFSSNVRPYIDTALGRTDLTFFLPNSAKAMATSANITGLNSTRWLELAAYFMFPRTIYSTDLVNGTELVGYGGGPVYVTIHEGDIYINMAKITSRDNFINNGVFHVVDDMQNPDVWPTRPSFPSSQNTTSTNTASAPINEPQNLPRNVKIGIAAGIVAGVVVTTLAVATIVWRRQLRSKNERESQKHGVIEAEELDGTTPVMLSQLEASESKGEMSTNSPHEFPQLETRESPVELPAEYFYHHEIGRAF